MYLALVATQQLLLAMLYVGEESERVKRRMEAIDEEDRKEKEEDEKRNKEEEAWEQEADDEDLE